MCFLIWQKNNIGFFVGIFEKNLQSLLDYNLAWGLPIHTMSDDFDLVSRSHIYQCNKKMQFVMVLV